MKKYYHHKGKTPTLTAPFRFLNVVDRTGVVIPNAEIEVLTPIGKITKPRSIEDICYNTVQRIIANTSGKLYVCWSGGIDSTLIVAEFLKYVPHDQLVILLNDNSIAEYELFYVKYIKDKLECRHFDYNTNSHLLESIKDGIIVTGNCLDPIFGINDYDSIPEHKLYMSLDSLVNTTSTVSQKYYEQLISACPRQLENSKDLFWWMEYVLNYQSEQLLWLLDIDGVNLNQHIFHFGDNDLWNDYAIYTPAEVKYPGSDMRNYKMVLKQHLEKFTKDSYYTQYKIKYPSWRRYRTGLDTLKNSAVYIDTDWNRGWSIYK